MNESDIHFMQLALEQAHQAEQAGEVPVGAVLVKEGAVIAAGYNQPISLSDPCAHAEIVTLRAAGQVLGNYRLLDTTLYVTLEPCVMCIGALLHARVTRIVYGAMDPKAGAIESIFQIPHETALNHRVVCEGGVLAAACSELLIRFFKEKRKKSPSELGDI